MPARRYLVAYSGGLDSHVLLHALQGLEGPPIQALHIHHGLLSEADQWSAHCREVCEALGVDLTTLRVDARPEAGQSPEAAAREARYAALAEHMQVGDVLLTAHHRDDQAETLLLQLLRGAGPAGLAAMPPWTPFGPGWLGRPLLDFARESLRDYARRHRLHWVEDPSNRDSRYDRNFLRHELMPLIRQRWPGAGATLARAADLQAQSLELQDALARLDQEDARGERPETLSVSALNRLSPARRRNGIRGWLADKGLAPPPRARLEAILDTVLKADWDAVPRIAWTGAEVRRYRDDLFAMPPLAVHDPRRIIAWDPRQPLSIPDLGLTLDAAAIETQGLQLLECEAPITVRFRQGGERCRLPGQTHSRALKSLFQEAGVPPWERDRVPLIYVGGQLLAVWGYWTCAADMQPGEGVKDKGET